MQSTFEGSQNLRPQKTLGDEADVQKQEQQRIASNDKRAAEGKAPVPGAAGRESIADPSPEAVDVRSTADPKAKTDVPQNDPVI